ncbi:HutD family protein [Streptomyces sp. B-S-A8]|uniref:HutD family protein n=1 Tax=Streptomyces solicavernae TaxID=3043614 RepID=A0ABT6RPD8_9ACTN|nr:HutD family protein [Streptomyces sp. B-S-A8]MDI3386301.1 HutD family protein [Streptomyces sp. B-S-A8]
MAPRILRADERTPAPWKNGGGVTSEVAAHPEGAGTGGFVWRVSVADVAHSGPFSAFAGVDRIITVVEGPGMALTVDGVSEVMDVPYEPFAFSGDAATECELLGGPIVDFNVMVRRAEMTASVRIVRAHTPVQPAVGTRVLAIVLEGSAVLHRAAARLGRLDAVLLSHEDSDDFGVDGVLAVVTLADQPGCGAPGGRPREPCGGRRPGRG